jgi:uncharacterized protein YggE
MKLRWLIFVLLMRVTAGCAEMQPATDQSPRMIQVEGHGEARANPDRAAISFEIVTRGSNAQEAGEQNAKVADKAIAALKAKVGTGGGVETGGYSVSPLYAQWPRPSGPNWLPRGAPHPPGTYSLPPPYAGAPHLTVTEIRDWSALNYIYVKCDQSVAGHVLDTAQAAGARGTANIQQGSGTAAINLTVLSKAKTASDASTLGTEKTRQIADTIKTELAGKGTVNIGQESVVSESQMVSNQSGSIGYEASSSISVETAAIDQVGSLIDTAIAAGATRASFVKFKLSDDSKARSAAIADASRDAQFKAAAAADALGLKIERVVKITSVGDFIPQEQQHGYRAAVFSAQTASARINPDELTVQATVSVTYELE